MDTGFVLFVASTFQLFTVLATHEMSVLWPLLPEDTEMDLTSETETTALPAIVALGAATTSARSSAVSGKKSRQLTPAELDANAKMHQLVEKRCAAVADKYEAILAQLRADHESLPPMIKDMMTAATMKKKCPERYTAELKDFSVKLYEISPKAFKFCQSVSTAHHEDHL